MYQNRTKILSVYIDVFDPQLIAMAASVNEKVVQALGYKSIEAAVNQDIIFSYGPGELTGQIVGVVRNYHQRWLKEGYDPMLYWYPAYDDWRYFSIQVKADHMQRTLAEVESVYKKVFAGNTNPVNSLKSE